MEVLVKGIKRNMPPGTDDGACDEVINMRMKHGAWTPVGEKELLYPPSNYDKRYIHKQDTFENWVGFNETTRNLEHYNPSGPTVIASLANISDELYDIRSLKNFLIVTTEDSTLVWRWNNDSYVLVTLTGLENSFKVTLSEKDPEEPSWTKMATISHVEGNDGSIDDNDLGSYEVTKAGLASLIGYYFEKVNNYSEEERLIGGLSFRVGLRLFDGSYIMHTIPRFYQIFPYDMQLEITGEYSTMEGIRMRFGAARVKAEVEFNTYGFSLDGLEDVVSSIDVFFSQSKPFYEISEDTLDVDLLDTLWQPWIDQAGGNRYKIQILNMRDLVPIDAEFKKLNDEPAFYKVGTIALSSLEQDPSYPNEYTGEITLDLKGFYKNYATRKILPIDNYSHHKVTGEASYIYNSRLHLGDTVQTLAQSRVEGLEHEFPTVVINDVEKEYEFQSLRTGHKVIVTLNTEGGVKKVISDLRFAQYQDPTNVNKKAFFLPSILGYFDSRATKAEIILYESGQYYKLAEFALTESEYGNYALYKEEEFLLSELTVPDYPGLYPRRWDSNFDGIALTYDLNNLPGVYTLPAADAVTKDGSNVQVSNVSNPFVYLVENFQQVSEGTVLAFGTNVDPISDSQFGQYPLYCFTTLGIQALQIGSGDVYISNVVPVNGEVILNKAAKQDTSFGTVYATVEGLKLLSGLKVAEISDNIEGLPDPHFTDNEELQGFLDNPQTVEVQNLIDKVRFKDYLDGALIGYNKSIDNSEIIVTNAAYDYSYIFDLTNNLWSKISESFTELVLNYPEIYGVNARGTVNLSNEVESNVSCYLQTRPLSLGGPDQFKKLRRTFVRGMFNTPTGAFTAAYIFGSDDSINWEFITGNDYNTGEFDNIWMTHSRNSKRYYILVFASQLAFPLRNRFEKFETEVHKKWAGKLR
jgi:hypothetical protein